MGNLSGIRSRVYQIILYPEDSNHNEVLDKIRERYDYVGILHDQDTYSTEDEFKNSENKAGSLKKPHYHIILKFGNARYLKPLAEDLGLPVQYIIKSSNIKRDMRYLVHADDKDKHQYQADQVFGTLLSEFQSCLEDRSEDDVFISMYQEFNSTDYPMSISQMALFFAQRGYYGQFRRNFALWNKILIEHNLSYGVSDERYD